MNDLALDLLTAILDYSRLALVVSFGILVVGLIKINLSHLLAYQLFPASGIGSGFGRRIVSAYRYSYQKLTNRGKPSKSLFRSLETSVNL